MPPPPTAAVADPRPAPMPGTRARRRSAAPSQYVAAAPLRARRPDAAVRAGRDELQAGRDVNAGRAVEPARGLDARRLGARPGRAGARPSAARFSLAIPVALISSLIGGAQRLRASRWRFPGADVVFTLILFGMFIPYQAVMIPLRQVTCSDLGVARASPTPDLVHMRLRHPDLHADLPQLLRHDRPGRADRGGPGGRRRAAADVPRRSSCRSRCPAFVVTIIWQFTSSWNDFLFAIFLSNTRNGPITHRAQRPGRRADPATTPPPWRAR